MKSISTGAESLSQQIESSEMKTQPKHILLIDDQPGVRQSCSQLLGIDGHTVEEASSGLEALALFATGRFDLVVTDFSMPGINGAELGWILKELVPSQRVLMITGFANALEGSEDSVDGILPKPFSLDELRQAISQLLC
jgi:CheY-like chemotaxis protein